MTFPGVNVLWGGESVTESALRFDCITICSIGNLETLTCYIVYSFSLGRPFLLSMYVIYSEVWMIFDVVGWNERGRAAVIWLEEEHGDAFDSRMF